MGWYMARSEFSQEKILRSNSSVIRRIVRSHMEWIMIEIKLMGKVRACPYAVQILGVFDDDEEDGIIPITNINTDILSL